MLDLNKIQCNFFCFIIIWLGVKIDEKETKLSDGLAAPGLDGRNRQIGNLHINTYTNI